MRAKLKLLNGRYGCLRDEHGEPIHGTFSSFPIHGHKRVAEFLATPSVQPFILGNHEGNMKRAFGQNPTGFRQGRDYWYAWPMNFKGKCFYVLTGRHGTIIEICGKGSRYIGSGRLADLAIEFVKDLQDALVPF